MKPKKQTKQKEYHCNIFGFKECSEEDYQKAGNISNEYTAYIRVGKDRTYFKRYKIPEEEIVTKTIKLSGSKYEIDKLIENIKSKKPKLELKEFDRIKENLNKLSRMK